MKETVSFSKNSINVFFHILTKCNLKCRHCYINPEQHGENTLPIETINKWLEAFYDKRKDANVIFLGGEPTLHPDLSTAVRKAKEIGYKSITIDSNGYLFHDILDKISPSDIDYISFSLDGASPETNDPIRGKGSYEHCTAGVRKAVEKGFGTSMIYTVSRSNIHDLENMPPLLETLGIDRFFIQVIGIRGNSAESGANDLQLTREEWTAIVPEIAGRVSRLGITVTWPKVFLEKDEVFECAGNVADNYFIFPNGRVYQCPICEDFPLHGKMFENDRLVNLPKLNESDFFNLRIPEGCVMNKLIQPDNLSYEPDGTPSYKIACCLLKEEIPAVGKS